MKKLLIHAILEYDETIIHTDDAEGKAWFYNDLLLGEVLILHSNEIGDDVGTVRVIDITEG